MKKGKKLLTLIPVLGLFLSGCDFSLESLMFWKKKDEQSSEKGGEGDGQQTSLFDQVVAKIKPVAAAFSGKSESSVTGADYEDEEAEADYYYVNKTDLVFAVSYYSPEDEDATLDDVYSVLKGVLPSGSVEDESKADEYEDIYYYSEYTSGDFRYMLYAIDFFYFGGSVTIVPESQLAAYEEYMESSEEEEEEEEEEDQSYMSPDFPASQIAEDLTSAGVTDTIPAYSASGSSFYYYTGADGRQIHISIPDGSSAAAVIASYVSDLKAAGYTEAGADDFGDMHYASPNGQIDVCAWDGADIGYSKTVFVDIELAE